MSKHTVTQVSNVFTYPLNNESKFSGDGYEVVLRDAYFRSGGETIFQPAINIIGFLLEKSCQLALCSKRLFRSDVTTDIQGVQFLPAHEPVYLRWSQGRHRFIYFQFDQSKFLTSLLPDFETNQRWPACTGILNPFITSGMQRLATILSNKKRIASNHVDLIVKTLTLEVLSTAGDIINSENHPSDRDTRCDDDGYALDVQSLHAFIDNFQGIPRIDIIAQHFDMNTRRLSFLYHKTTGRMLRTHLAETRINKAEGLLLGTDMLIKQVAYACNFSSPASFNGAFVAARGLSPAVFRRRGGL